MNILHSSFSLSACPKCHLLICQHTSLATLDFSSIQQPLPSSSLSEGSSTTLTNMENSYQQRSSHGMNFYLFSSTTPDQRHSWTTFESTNTLHNLSLNNETISEAIPFANENILESSLPLTPMLNQILRTQSEIFDNNSPKPIYLIKSLSFSTIYNQSASFSQTKDEDHSLTKSYSSFNRSFFLIILLILSFLITNTFDIVLLYIYYYTDYIHLISFISIIILCDLILWINSLIHARTIPSSVLFIPFMIRFYLLYDLIDLLASILDRNEDTQLLDSSSSSSTTFETNISQTTDSPVIPHSSSCQIKKQRSFHHLTLFYLIHTGFFVLINFYFWSNDFQFSSKSSLNMEYFIPRWTFNEDLLSTTINPVSSTVHWQMSDNNREQLPRRAMSTNWTHLSVLSYIPISIRPPSSSSFVLTSILYYLIINYCVLSTFLILKRFSWISIPSILSRLCLTITRIYSLIFLFHLSTWCLLIIFLIIHLILIITLLCHQFKYQHKRKTLFLQVIFSFLSQNSIDNISINVLISLENILIFLYHLYIAPFSFYYDETTLRLVIFISILISLQIIGFILDILSKQTLYRIKPTM